VSTQIDIRNLSGQDVDSAPLAATARAVLAAETAALVYLSVALVDDERITQLNERLLGRSHPTDVIAFEAEDGEGEIIISVETAARQADEWGSSLPEELRFLMAHGVLHVLGWDDTAADDRQRMLERQHEIIEQH